MIHGASQECIRGLNQCTCCLRIKQQNQEIMSTYPEVPGEPTQPGTAFLETATATIQNFAPINKIHQHLCAYLFASSSSCSFTISLSYDLSVIFQVSFLRV
jgi:hypothetical protein